MEAEIHYLRRLDLYHAEKPFMTTFDVSHIDGASWSNHEYISTKVTIRNARPIKNEFKLDIHGYQYEVWETALTHSDFDDDSTVVEKYYPETLSNLRRLLPLAKDFVILKHVRRRSRPDFPLSDKPRAANDPVVNPVIFAHTDFTTQSAVQRMARRLKGRPELMGRPFEILNIWRVTRGPNRDWPLALCDYSTVAKEDLEATDIIHRDYVGESMRLYPNDVHQWYYLPDQEVDEVAIFRNADSRGDTIPLGFHAAFDNGLSGSSPFARESIELRIACIY